MKRTAYIDFLRGSSIIGVILIHMVFIYPESKESFVLAKLLDVFFHFAVPVFIGILGYMTREKYISVVSWTSFYRRRFVELGLPFLIWTAIYANTPPTFLENSAFPFPALLIGAEIHLYYMTVYFSFLLITPFVVSALKRLSTIQVVAVMLLAVVVHLVLLAAADIGMQHGYENWFVRYRATLPIHWLGPYAIGILISVGKVKVVRFAGKLQGSLPLLLATVTHLVVVMYALFSAKAFYSYYSPIILLIGCSGVIWLTAVFLTVPLGRVFHWIEHLGRHSFAVYLSHMLIIKAGYLLYLKQSWSIGGWFLLTGLTLIGSLVYVFLHSWLFRSWISPLQGRKMPVTGQGK